MQLGLLLIVTLALLTFSIGCGKGADASGPEISESAQSPEDASAGSPGTATQGNSGGAQTPSGFTTAKPHAVPVAGVTINDSGGKFSTPQSLAEYSLKLQEWVRSSKKLPMTMAEISRLPSCPKPLPAPPGTRFYYDPETVRVWLEKLNE